MRFAFLYIDLLVTSTTKIKPCLFFNWDKKKFIDFLGLDKEYVESVESIVQKKTGKSTEEIITETLAKLMIDTPYSKQSDQRANIKMYLQMKFGDVATDSNGLKGKKIKDMQEVEFSEQPPLMIDDPNKRKTESVL